MSDNPSIDPGTTPSIPVEGDDIGSGVIRQGVVVSFGAKDASGRVTAGNPLPTTDAAVETSTASIATGVGAPADAAWASGNGSIIAVLKGIFGKLAATLTVAGSGVFHIDDNGGTLSVDDGGSSVTVDGTVATTSAAASQADGHSATIGAQADASSANTLVGLLKAIKAAVTGTIAVSGTFWQATQPVSGTVTANAGTGTLATNDATTRGTLTSGNMKSQIVDSGAVNVATVTAGGLLKVDASQATLTTAIAPIASGGLSVSRLLSAGSTNATNVKASAGQLCGWYLKNSAAYDVFLKLYNASSAPTAGSGTPLMTIPVPAGGGANVNFIPGIAFSTGIGFTITKLVADADTTVVVANDLVVNLFYA